MDALNVVRQAAAAAAAKKAVRIVAQDLRGVSDVCQFQLICSGLNERQNMAICAGIEGHLKQNFGLMPAAIEGKKSAVWVVMDFGPTIVHIFADEIRDYYALDNLWPEAQQIKI